MRKVIFSLLTLVFAMSAMAEDIIFITPFNTTAGATSSDAKSFDIELNNTQIYYGVFFDLYLPEGMELDGDEDFAPFDELSTDRYPYTTDRRGNKTFKHSVMWANRGGGWYRFSITSEDLEAYIDGSEGAILTLYYTTSSDMKDGIYPIKIGGQGLMLDETTVYPEKPAVSYIVVGNPSNSNSVYDFGDCYVPEVVESELNGMDNIVVNGTCNNLVITDGAPMNFSAPFTAVNVSYDRNVTNDWGTICLPYAISSDDDIQLYQLKEKSGETLIFSEVSSLEAGKPGVFKRLDTASSVTMSASNAPIVVSVGEGNVAESLKMIGTFEDITVTVDPSAPSYYIKDNTFLKGNGNFKIPAYRAYFQSEGPSSVKVFNIAVEDEETGVTTVVGKLDAESGEIFSINGMKISEPAHNSLYIKNGKKFIAK